MSSEETNVPTPNPTDSRPPELQRGSFTRVNTYISEDLATKLRNVPSRIRKSVTEGYKTWEGEPIAPATSHKRDPRAQLGHGPMRPSIFQSSNNEGFRRVMTTPNPLPSNSGYSGIPRFADFGEPPARPIPTNGGVRARVASLGNYPPSLPATSRQGSSSSKHTRALDGDSDSESESEFDVNEAKSAADSDAFGELFEAGEEKGSGASSMFGSRPAALPVAGEPRQPRTFQQTQSLPAGSLEFGIGTGHGVSTLEPLDEDEPWRQHDFSRYASIPPE